MKLNKRIGETLKLVKIEYKTDYQKAINADLIADYLHALCSYYNELVGKNISLSNPIEFACKYYRMYLQGMLCQVGYQGDQSKASIYTYFNTLIAEELHTSKIRQKEIKLSLWQQYSAELLSEFTHREDLS
ncbi:MULTISPECIES: hypothetical protein [Sphingobacterium]|uniref:Phage integrase SAM-like domain-containing protein n=1 Tax=Sphingobacterium populi TaxID=1812824 RepID=A0ABW5UF16_9SPHI|nr:hypothetical protein [Sphingobacterium sp. CFCC 11742]